MLSAMAITAELIEDLSTRLQIAENRIRELEPQAELYRRGYDLMNAADISEYLELCAGAGTWYEKLERLSKPAKLETVTLGFNQDDYADDVCSPR